MTDGQIQNLIKANKVLLQNALANNSFSEEDKNAIYDRIYIVRQQLRFWEEEDDRERYVYDLKDQIRWMLRNFP